MQRLVKNSRTVIGTGALALSLATGCDPDGGAPAQKIDSAVVAQQSATRASDIVKQAGRALTFAVAEDSMLSKLMDGDAGGGVLGAKRAMPSPLPPPLVEAFGRSAAIKSLSPARPMTFLSTEEQFDETAADIDVFLRERVLTDANIETKSETQVTYLLKPDPTCKPLPSAVASGTPLEVDAECAEDLQKLQVRVVVTGDGDGARFQILLGPAKHELSVFVIHSDLLKWETDLAKARKAGEFAQQATSTGPTEPFPFTTFEGRVSLGLQKLGEKKVEFTASALAPIALDAKDDPVSIRLDKSVPTLSLMLDGGLQQATALWSLGKLDVKTAWDPKDEGKRNLDLHVSVGGMYGKVQLKEQNDEAKIEGLGVGASFVAVRGAHIFDLNLNPTAGRKFDLTVISKPNDQSRIEIAPQLDLNLGFKLMAIANEFEEAPPSYLMNETYRVLLNAGGAASAVESLPSSATSDGGLKVAVGTLELSTSANAAATVRVPAGKCLMSQEAAPGAHPLLGALKAADCP